MSLKTDLKKMVDEGKQYDDDELFRLSNKYGIDSHEMSFLVEAAADGKLGNIRGIDLDQEVDDGRE